MRTINLGNKTNAEKTYNVSFLTSFGKVSYQYTSYQNEVVDVMYKGEYQCTARNGKRLVNKINGAQQYSSVSRQVEGF